MGYTSVEIDCFDSAENSYMIAIIMIITIIFCCCRCWLVLYSVLKWWLLLLYPTLWPHSYTIITIFLFSEPRFWFAPFSSLNVNFLLWDLRPSNMKRSHLISWHSGWFFYSFHLFSFRSRCMFLTEWLIEVRIEVYLLKYTRIIQIKRNNKTKI